MILTHVLFTLCTTDATRLFDAGDRKVSYMRDCHAKLYEWTDVMQKLVRETEVETQQRRTTAKATVHPGLEPLEEAQQVPLLEILAHAAKNTDATVATATIARHTLVELLNARYDETGVYIRRHRP